jgi:CHAT domain-containing protein/Tfp pilus assembly protein PilF
MAYPARVISRSFSAHIRIALPLIAGMFAQIARADLSVLRVESLRIDRATVLQVGDRLRSARDVAADTTFELRTVLDWRSIELDSLARGKVVISGERAGTAMRWTVHEGDLDVDLQSWPAVASASDPIRAWTADEFELRSATRAVDGPLADSIYSRPLPEIAPSAFPLRAYWDVLGARAALAVDDRLAVLQRADSGLASLAGRAAQDATSQTLRALLLQLRGIASLRDRDTPAALRAFEQAAELIRQWAPASGIGASNLALLAEAKLQAGQNAEARKEIVAAIVALRRTLGPGHELAKAQLTQSSILRQMDEMAGAYAAAREATAIMRKLAANSAVLVTYLVRLADLARSNGGLEVADAAIREAESLAERGAASELQRADVYNARGTLAMMHGAVRSAQKDFERAVAVYLRTDPDSVRTLQGLNNLGYAARERGDLASAFEHLSRAVDIGRAIAPQRLNLAYTLHNIAQVSTARGDFEGALAQWQEAAAIEAAINARGPSYATTLLAIGATLSALSRSDEAEDAYASALTIFAEQAPACLCLAPALIDFAYFDLLRGNTYAALGKFSQALDLLKRAGQSGAIAAVALRGIGETEIALNRFGPALAHLRHALTIEHSSAADSPTLAQTQFLIGRSSQLLGKHKAALDSFCAAAATVDRVRLPFASDSLAQSRFRAQFTDIYRACLRAQLEAGAPQAAFLSDERARARGFLNALQSRDLEFVHADGAALARRWQADNRALDVRRAQASLPLGALSLNFVVDENDTLIFALTRQTLRVLKVPFGTRWLALRVERLRGAIARRDDADLAEIKSDSAQLYQLFIYPFLKELVTASQLLISADGPLHRLPFAALWNEQTSHWLIESIPLTMIDSLSARVLLAARRSNNAGNVLLAIGDPQPAGAAPASPALAAQLRALSPLPAARAEVLALANDYPGDSVVLVGENATESRVKAAVGTADVLHFAVHALLDRTHPMDSALVLRGDAAQGKEDGLLQAWEIFAQFELTSRLVVLSGCDTGAGADLGSEGVLGLTRAFQFAGAAAVVASLWPVEDAPTAALMRQFYLERNVRSNPARSMQAAAIAMIHSADRLDSSGERGAAGLRERTDSTRLSAHPYHWAAFQVYGSDL